MALSRTTLHILVHTWPHPSTPYYIGEYLLSCQVTARKGIPSLRVSSSFLHLQEPLTPLFRPEKTKHHQCITKFNLHTITINMNFKQIVHETMDSIEVYETMGSTEVNTQCWVMRAHSCSFLCRVTAKQPADSRLGCLIPHESIDSTEVDTTSGLNMSPV